MMPTRWVHVGIDLAVSLVCRLSVEMCTAMPTCCPLHVLPTSTSSILHMSMMPYIMRQLPLRNYLRHHQIYKRYYTNSRTGSTGSSTIEPIVRPTLINQPNPIQSNPIQSLKETPQPCLQHPTTNPTYNKTPPPTSPSSPPSPPPSPTSQPSNPPSSPCATTTSPSTASSSAPPPKSKTSKGKMKD